MPAADRFLDVPKIWYEVGERRLLVNPFPDLEEREHLFELLADADYNAVAWWFEAATSPRFWRWGNIQRLEMGSKSLRTNIQYHVYIYIYRDNITTYNISYIYMNYNVCILYIYMVESSSHLGMLGYPFLHSFQTTFKLAGFDNEEWDFSAQHLRNCCRLEVPIIFCWIKGRTPL